jgi:flagellar export protein FliJ
MAFRFSLQALLHLRKSIEHQQELKLRAANQRLSRVRHLLEQLEQQRLEQRLAQSRQLTDGTTAAELRFQLQCEGQLQRHRREVEQQLAILEKARNQQREILQNARRARETLEALRDQQLGVHEKEARRREQRNLDDLFLMRLLARRAHPSHG